MFDRKAYMKEYNKKYSKEYRKTHKLEIKERKKYWRKQNPDKVRARKARYRKRYPEKVRLAHRSWVLKNNFGISIEQYKDIFDKQGGCCAICGIHSSKYQRTLAVDHNHITNKVRGLLCFNCNNALGRFKDSPEIMRKAIKYIEIKPIRNTSRKYMKLGSRQSSGYTNYEGYAT